MRTSAILVLPILSYPVSFCALALCMGMQVALAPAATCNSACIKSSAACCAAARNAQQHSHGSSTR
jgi:hypothetical protein